MMSTHQGPPRSHRRPRESNARLKIAICVLAVVTVAAVGAAVAWRRVAANIPVASASPTVTDSTALPAPAQPSPMVIPAAPADNGLALSFDELAQNIGADVGLAFAPLGNPGQVQTFGEWSTGPAWSTIKVPLALAVLDQSGSVSSAMQSAITASDNGAAESMWEELGGGEEAASKVESVLVAAGNPQTDVPSVLRRSGFSIFGQTEWSLADQVRFLGHIDCDSRAAPVLDLMGQITSGQRWGLGGIDGAQFKGGWGPGTDGLYLVRQYGVIPTATGKVAVAIAAVADSGTFGGGTAALNSLTGWLQDHLDQLGGGQCPGA